MNQEPPDLGPPIAGLGELEDEVSPEFLRGVRNRIDRRRTSGQLVSFALEAPLLLLREFVSVMDTPPTVFPKDKNRWK